MTIELAALLIGTLALAVSLLAWRAAVEANRTARFDRRFEVYADVSKYIGIWTRNGCPDTDELPSLVRAWDRSHFLFEDDIPKYIRTLWTNSLDAEYAHAVMSEKAPGDRVKAVEQVHALTLKHCDAEAVRQVFLPHLRVYSDGWWAELTSAIRKKFWT